MEEKKAQVLELEYKCEKFRYNNERKNWFNARTSEVPPIAISSQLESMRLSAFDAFS